MGLEIASIILTIITLFSGGLGVWIRMEKRQEKLSVDLQHLQSQLDRIEGQFGPNGGGLREAVNTLSVSVTLMAERVTKIGEDLARLSGEFHAKND